MISPDRLAALVHIDNIHARQPRYVIDLDNIFLRVFDEAPWMRPPFVADLLFQARNMSAWLGEPQVPITLVLGNRSSAIDQWEGETVYNPANTTYDPQTQECVISLYPNVISRLYWDHLKDPNGLTLAPHAIQAEAMLCEEMVHVADIARWSPDVRTRFLAEARRSVDAAVYQGYSTSPLERRANAFVDAYLMAQYGQSFFVRDKVVYRTKT